MNTQTQVSLKRFFSRGFSLVELMTVLGISAVLLGIGAPSFQGMMRSQKMTTTVNEFFSAVNLARSEAIKRGTRVDLVPVDQQDWANGWTVFVDKNKNQIPDAEDDILIKHGPAPLGMTIQSGLTDSSKPYLAYSGTGHTRTNNNPMAPQIGTWTFKLDDKVRRLKISFLGRPRTCNPENDSTCTGNAESN